MDTSIAPILEPVEAARPRFDLRDIPQATRVLAGGIEDLNADALDAICPGCKATLSWGQWLNASFNRNRQITCHACSLPISVKDLTKEPIPAYRLEEVQATGYFDRVWHHATRSEHWAEEVMDAEQGQLLIHAGSKLAALSLANDLRRDYQRGTEPIFVHSFMLSGTGGTEHGDRGRHYGRLARTPRRCRPPCAADLLQRGHSIQAESARRPGP